VYRQKALRESSRKAFSLQALAQEKISSYADEHKKHQNTSKPPFDRINVVSQPYQEKEFCSFRHKSFITFEAEMPTSLICFKTASPIAESALYFCLRQKYRALVGRNTQHAKDMLPRLHAGYIEALAISSSGKTDFNRIGYTILYLRQNIAGKKYMGH